jgi:type I restriction enzyme S subunit
MTLETFFKKFDLFADAPDAVAKMRELILRLAMQGKLVSQNPRDEPADRLVEKLKAEIGDKNGRRSSLLPSITPDEVPFDLPEGWVWERLGNIGETNIGLTYSPQDVSAVGTPVLRSSNIQNGKLDFDDLVRVTCVPKQSVMVQDGDLLICARNGSRALVGKVALIENLKEPAAFGAFMAIFRSRVNRFLYHFICSPLFRRMIDEVGTTTINQITQNNLRSTLAPLPPLAEQKRIVAKVDELMALCDRLEAQQQEREEQASKLARASLARFADAPTPANLPFLFHPSYAIPPADLRKSILTLAVQGKLVPQDPNDEPAEELLERVASALPDKKSENPFLGAIEPSITDESEYELPPGWAWLPLGHVGIWATGCGFPMQYQGETDGEFLFCKVSDMNLPGNEVEIHTTVHKIDADVMKKIRARANPVGTVIFPKIGGAIATHKRRLVIQPTIIDNNCSGIQPIGLTDDSWLLLFLRNLDLTKYQSGTSVPAVSQGSLDPIRIGLPPLAEQRRIVAKVEQLMALVDALETQLAASRATAAHLLSALVAELTGTVSRLPATS